MASSSRQIHNAKPMRKGTRSCRECRRRKIKCIYPNRSDACHQCIENARTCQSQGVAVGASSSSASRNIRIHVAGLELAVQRLAREGSYTGESTKPTRGAQSFDTFIETTTDDLAGSDLHARWRSPWLSLFNNDLLVNRKPHDPLPPEISSLAQFDDLDLPDREKLLSTISGEPDLPHILDSTGQWWVSWRNQHFSLRKSAGHLSLSAFVQQNLASERPEVVAIGLLCIAVAMTYVRPGVDDLSFRSSVPPSHLITRITTAVDQLVLTQKTYVQTPDAILLFVLRAKIHAECDQVRKVWLRFRQAIAVAKAIGFASPRAGTPPEDIAEQQRFVGSIFEVDRYMSMLMGFPYSTDSSFHELQARQILLGTTDDLSLRVRALRRMVATCAGRVVDRNARPDVLDDQETNGIQQDLEMMHAHLPGRWWDPVCQLELPHTDEIYDNLMAQLWFWGVQAHLHLPYLVNNRASNDDVGASPMQSLCTHLCLEGARHVLQVFSVLRTEPSVAVYVCNCDDLQGLIAACIVLVGALRRVSNHGPDQPRDGGSPSVDDDLDLVEETKRIFEYRASEQGGSISRQGLRVLQELTSFLEDDDEQDDDDDGGGGGNREENKELSVREKSRQRSIMLPYFGTIHILSTQRLARWNVSKKGNTEHYSCDDDGSVPPSTEQGSRDVVEGPSLESTADFPLLDFGQWDHFMRNAELGQDWNPTIH